MIRRETLRDAFRRDQDDLLKSLASLGGLAQLAAPTDFKIKYPGASQPPE
jgi:hypothetical protein